jgi:NodT family efflux transporter outer membrane factor (OMF) lipoprotein
MSFTRNSFLARALALAPAQSLALTLVLALAAALGACALPPGDLPQAAPRAEDALGLTGAAAQPAAEDWWTSFGDPQLDHLIGQAMADNPGLAQAGARLRAAQAQAAAAHALQFPDVNLKAGETRLKVPSDFPRPLGGSTIWGGNLGALLSWDVDLWGKQAAAVEQARSLVQAAGLDTHNARLLLAGALAQSYVELYRSWALADIAQRSEAQRLKILDITRKRVAAGLDTRVELREAEGAVPQARVALMQAQSAQALAVHQLAAIAGRGADAYADIQRPQLQLDAALPLPTQLPINLLARRPDVIAARLRLAAADAGKRAAKAAFYPQISLSAFAGYASISAEDLIKAGSFGYGIGPSVSLPLFDGGRLRAQYRGAEAAIDEAVAGYNDTVLGAVRQAADQLSLIDALSRELEQQRASLEAAEDAYRLAEERYQAGLASYLSVLNAETEVLNARRQRVDLSAARVIARVSLLLAVGGSFQPPQALQAAAAP